jgi:hypothetical protein
LRRHMARNEADADVRLPQAAWPQRMSRSVDLVAGPVRYHGPSARPDSR